MRQILLNLLIIATLASCSTAYKAGQTPDDVYYSPTHEIAKKEDKDDKKDDKKDKYEEYASAEDQYLHRKVKDHRRWSELDEYEYRYDCRYNYNYDYYRMKQAYYYGYTYGYNNCSCACNNSVSIYHPSYYGYYPTYGYPYNPYIIRQPQKSTYKPNLGGYHGGGTYNNNNGIGNTLKKVFSSGSGGYNNRNSDNGSYKTSTDRSYTPSSGSSSSGSSSGRVARPGRH